METSDFGKTSLSCQYDETSYNGPSETKRLTFHYFFTSVVFLKHLWIDFFFIFNAPFSCTFLGHQLQYELPQTQGLLVYLS